MLYKLKSASHVSLTYQPHPFLQGAFHLTQPHPHAGKRKHGRSSTVMPWTTTDEFSVVPKTQRMSLASFPWHRIVVQSCGICLIILWRRQPRPISENRDFHSKLTDIPQTAWVEGNWLLWKFFPVLIRYDFSRSAVPVSWACVLVSQATWLGWISVMVLSTLHAAWLVFTTWEPCIFRRLTFQSCSRYQLNQLGSKAASEPTFEKSNICGYQIIDFTLLYLYSPMLFHSWLYIEWSLTLDCFNVIICLVLTKLAQLTLKIRTGLARGNCIPRKANFLLLALNNSFKQMKHPNHFWTWVSSTYGTYFRHYHRRSHCLDHIHTTTWHIHRSCIGIL